MKNPMRKFILPVILILVTLIGVTSAKYIQTRRTTDNAISAEGFYFTVDLLGNTNEKKDLTKEIHLYGSGTQSITLNVMNHFDKLRVTNSEIKYSVSVTSTYEGIQIKKGNESYSSGTSCTMESGRSVTDPFTVTIPGGFPDQQEVTITIASSKPYKKEMNLNIVLHTMDSEVSYRVEDSVNSPYATLIVMSNVDVVKEKLIIDLSAINDTNNVLQVDTTNAYVLDDNLVLNINDPNNGYLKQVKNTKKIDAGASLAIYLFKTDITKNYSVGDKPVMIVDGIYTIRLLP